MNNRPVPKSLRENRRPSVCRVVRRRWWIGGVCRCTKPLAVFGVEGKLIISRMCGNEWNPISYHSFCSGAVLLIPCNSSPGTMAHFRHVQVSGSAATLSDWGFRQNVCLWIRDPRTEIYNVRRRRRFVLERRLANKIKANSGIKGAGEPRDTLGSVDYASKRVREKCRKPEAKFIGWKNFLQFKFESTIDIDVISNTGRVSCWRRADIFSW